MKEIVLTQGDDSNALGRKIIINIDTQLDLTSWTATFQLEGVIKKFLDISSKKVELILSKADTGRLRAGRLYGGFKVFDQNGLAKTEKRDICFLVKTKVVTNE